MSTHDCSIIQPLLGAYLDGEIEGEAAARLDLHLEGCGDCRTVLGELAETDRLLRDDSIPMPTAMEWAAVEWKLLARARRIMAARVVKVCALAAAAALVVGALVWLAAQVVPSGPTFNGPRGYTAQSENKPDADERPLGVSVEHGESF